VAGPQRRASAYNQETAQIVDSHFAYRVSAFDGWKIFSMPELSPDFQSMPEEYQQLIRQAQDANAITVAPLQLLVGGGLGGR
jgi:hypothetical protein